MLMPRQPVPSLNVPLLGEGAFDLSSETPDWGTLVVFYRGYHCPICATYLTDLNKRTAAFAERGLTTVAISSDTQERAQMMSDKIGATDLRIGYDLSLKKAREWGLYISSSRGKTSAGVEEPALFSEPGVFIVRPDGTLYYGSTQTMPFARPHFVELVSAIDFAQANDYPARGEVVAIPDVGAAA